MLEKVIRNQVDIILYEEGGFSPLTWLLREGTLDDADYLQWRNGEVDFLENRFKASIKKVISELAQVNQYARLLKLEDTLQSYTSVKGNKLYFSRNPAREKIYTSIYEPAEDRIQMDLFYDSSPACTANDLVLAITINRHEDIAALQTRLKSLDFDKYQQFEQLLAIRNDLTDSSETSLWKIRLLEQTLTPLAFALLGQFAHNFLTPLWCEISANINGLRFDTCAPDNHLSYTAMKSFRWQEVLSAVEREPDWQEQPLLLFRYAEAQFKLRDELEGLKMWFRLFLFYPEQAEQFVGKTCNRLLLSDWQSFLGLDPELENQFFAAWVLLHRPALGGYGINFNGSSVAVVSFQLVSKLVAGTDDGFNEAAVQVRKELKQKNSTLFEHLMDALS